MFFMALAIIVFLIPLRTQSLSYGLNSQDMVFGYYLSSLAIIIVAQIVYLHPFNRINVISWQFLIGGIAILLILITFWISQVDGVILNFSRLAEGELLGPIVMAVGLTTIHGFINLASISHK
jgi:hypothetical protein